MSREIKFRGKRTDGNELLIGDLNHIDGAVFIFPRTDDTPNNSPDWFEVIPETVGQFTGLLDKNKKEIYEGDICKAIEPSLNQLIEIDKTELQLLGEISITERGIAFGYGYAYDFKNIEIIGNIYENENLLK